MKMTKIAGFAALIGLTGVAVANAYTLADGNSTVNYDPATGAGMTEWKINGVNQLNRQWFWYRVGNTGGEQNISTLVQTTDVQTRANRVNTTFTAADGSFRITIEYTLLGGTAVSTRADIAESIRIVNLSTSGNLNISFFQYSDFDLAGTANNDIGKVVNANAIQQWDSTSGTILSETTITPPTTHHEIGTAAGLLSKLVDGAPTDLSDSPITGVTFGETNVAWAFQWDFAIAAGDAALISKDKRITSSVPDAGATLALLGAALTGLAFVGRRFARR